jgi:hypothetical protein
MTIHEIKEIQNPHLTKMKPIKEKQDVFIPNIINQNISRRNGMVYALTGSGGSGKSSLMLNMFKDKNMYRTKFNNIYYFCPMASFSSVMNHPFEKHELVYHELTVPILEDIYNELVDKKQDATKKKEKKKKYYDGVSSSSSESDDEPKEIEYSAIILDDFADALKTPDIQRYLNKMIIKARHLCLSFFITLQSYTYLPKTLRKQLTYATIFKPKNIEEFNSIAGEILHLNKEDALKVYNYVFNEPYTHLDIDTTTTNLYKNFNKLIIS